MRKHAMAVHEAAHALLGHYFGFEIKKLSFADNGDAEMEINFTDKAREQPALGLNYFLMLAGGYIAAFMDSGPETFWKCNPTSLLKKSPDLEAMKKFDFDTVSSKEELTNLLTDLHALISKPKYWGKIQSLADDFRDAPDGFLEDNIDILIARCTRERIPEYDPTPLINFMVAELMAGQDSK